MVWGMTHVEIVIRRGRLIKDFGMIQYEFDYLSRQDENSVNSKKSWKIQHFVLKNLSLHTIIYAQACIEGGIYHESVIRED